MSRSTTQFNDTAGNGGSTGSSVNLNREIESFTLNAPVVAGTTEVVLTRTIYDINWVDVQYQNIALDRGDFQVLTPNRVRFLFDDPGVGPGNEIEVEVRYVYATV